MLLTAKSWRASSSPGGPSRRPADHSGLTCASGGPDRVPEAGGVDQGVERGASLRALRSRVAHQETLINVNVIAYNRMAIRLLKAIDNTVGDWYANLSRVPQIAKRRLWVNARRTAATTHTSPIPSPPDRLICGPYRHTMMRMALTKDSRLAVRMTAEDEALIRAAADAERATVTDFMVTASVRRARDTLADRRIFLLDDATWAQFTAVLDRPAQRIPALEKALAEPSIFTDEP